MEFPLSITANINSHEGNFSRKIELRSPLTFIVGPNGSGKTHLLKGLKGSKESFNVPTGKKVRFISAGRLAPLEQYRSKTNQFNYDIDDARLGDKYETNYRHEIESISGDLHTLYKRPDILIKVQERLRKLFKRDIKIEWDSGYLKVSFLRIGASNTYYSSAREASGLLHLVGILSALYDDEVGVLLIDEPEVSLHPQLQAFLLKEITRVAGIPGQNNYKKIIVMATHSTEMIKISKTDDLLSFIFCNDLKEDPIQIPKDAGELQNKHVKSLVARLGQEHKLALFSRTPLLVEGPSDVIICNTLSDKLYLNLEAAGSQILPINGKEAMPETVKLFRLMGKIPTILVDADAFADSLDLVRAYFNDEQIRNAADRLVSKQSGYSGILVFAEDIYNNFCSLVQNNWDSIANIAQEHSYFTLSGNELLSKKRSALCAVFNEKNLNYDWNNIKNRLSLLFDFFEKMGLFILKKGALESYYHDNNAITDKVDDAVTESEYILSSSEELESTYQDILKCLKYASNSESIDESRAIRDELLSFVSPIHAHYVEGAENLDALGRQSSIFDYQINEGKLKISINSNVLDVTGFPIILNRDDDVRKVVNHSLGIE
jgi:hypothetical protein